MHKAICTAFADSLSDFQRPKKDHFIQGLNLTKASDLHKPMILTHASLYLLKERWSKKYFNANPTAKIYGIGRII